LDANTASFLCRPEKVPSLPDEMDDEVYSIVSRARTWGG
jgi:hypothetical protein